MTGRHVGHGDRLIGKVVAWTVAVSKQRYSGYENNYDAHLLRKFKQESVTELIATEPQGLATDKKRLFERPSKRRNVAISLGTQGFRWETHEGVGDSSPSKSNRASDISDT